jgi:hypothetical protein
MVMLALVRVANDAIDVCEHAAGGTRCVPFARNGEIVMRVLYEIPHD